VNRKTADTFFDPRLETDEPGEQNIRPALHLLSGLTDSIVVRILPDSSRTFGILCARVLGS
jgi:hypothetical protein